MQAQNEQCRCDYELHMIQSGTAVEHNKSEAQQLSWNGVMVNFLGVKFQIYRSTGSTGLPVEASGTTET